MAVEMFQKTPLKDLHHRTTWKWLAPDSQYRAEVDKFIAGASRLTLPRWFLSALCEFRLIPIAESIIEQKHSTVALDAGHRRVGPVRVSLSNRMKLMETMFDQDPIQSF